MDVRKQHLPPTEVDILSPEHHHFDDIPFMICKKTKKCMLLLCICNTCYVDDDVDDTILYYTLLYCSLWSTYRSRWWSTCFVLGCQKGSKDDEKDIFSCYVLLLLHKEGSNTFSLKCVMSHFFFRNKRDRFVCTTARMKKCRRCCFNDGGDASFSQKRGDTLQSSCAEQSEQHFNLSIQIYARRVNHNV